MQNLRFKTNAFWVIISLAFPHWFSRYDIEYHNFFKKLMEMDRVVMIQPQMETIECMVTVNLTWVFVSPTLNLTSSNFPTYMCILCLTWPGWGVSNLTFASMILIPGRDHNFKPNFCGSPLSYLARCTLESFLTLPGLGAEHMLAAVALQKAACSRPSGKYFCWRRFIFEFVLPWPTACVRSNSILFASYIGPFVSIYIMSKVPSLKSSSNLWHSQLWIGH